MPGEPIGGALSAGRAFIDNEVCPGAASQADGFAY